MRVLWDASSLAKRYIPELGSETVEMIWNAVPPRQMISTFTGYAEVFWILLKKRNGGSLSPSDFVQAKSALRLDLIESDIGLLTINDADVLSGINLMEEQNLNSADAAILSAYLKYVYSSGENCRLVAADQRLLRAASAEGMAVLNPETATSYDIQGFFANLI